MMESIGVRRRSGHTGTIEYMAPELLSEDDGEYSKVGAVVAVGNGLGRNGAWALLTGALVKERSLLGIEGADCVAYFFEN